MVTYASARPCDGDDEAERQQNFHDDAHDRPLPCMPPGALRTGATPPLPRGLSTADPDPDPRCEIAPPRSPEADRAKSWRHFGDGAIVVLKVLGVAAAFKREAVGEQDEAGLAAEIRADRGERPCPHVRLRVRDPVGEQFQGLGGGEVFGIEPAGDSISRPLSAIVMARQARRARAGTPSAPRRRRGGRNRHGREAAAGCATISS